MVKSPRTKLSSTPLPPERCREGKATPPNDPKQPTDQPDPRKMRLSTPGVGGSGGGFQAVQRSFGTLDHDL